MRTLAVLPVKSFDLAKQRLGERLADAPRRALAEAMLADVLVALRRCSQLYGVLVVTNDPQAQRIAAGYGAEVLDQDGGSHSAAAMRGVAHAIAGRAEQALLVPGDCPMLDPEEIDGLLAADVEPPSVVVVPDRHGTGTNALLLTPPDAISPSFGEGSCARHLAAGRAAGAYTELARLPSLALDIDTNEDLHALAAELAARRGGAAHTRELLSQLIRSEAG